MIPETSLITLLRWRGQQAEADAPPHPRAAQLLALARPWWETWPEQFHAAAHRLGQLQPRYGYAMSEDRSGQSAPPVPALLVFVEAEQETFARVLYFNVRDRWLRLRFQLEQPLAQARPAFEVTFVSEDAQPLFSTRASLSLDTEYRLDAELPEALETDWRHLKVTDRMPFRLILRADARGE